MTMLWLLLLLPLASAVVISLVARPSRTVSAAVSTGSALATLAICVWFLYQKLTGVASFEWMKIGGFTASIGLDLSPLSRGMLFIVTCVGALVHVYSLGYMKEDAGKSRYYAGLSLFMFSMTGIVLADNLVMMFIFWELVGVSSYILIGHWFEKDVAADAAKKAFITNRVGDFGFLIGILLIWRITGSVYFSEMANAATPGLAAQFPTMLGVAVLCLFCGAIGKSAQFPLHVWLPDAMEGPTPVSALIHAATMVAAGVYMLARIGFLLVLTDASVLIAWIGGFTALLAAVIALQQSDIKRILAYSTLSQLGYMVMAMGLDATDGAGMFHLYTHAFFKALLFLGSGAVIYACHHEQDIWKMGGLARRMGITFTTFAIGTMALIAVPFVTSGFFSKEFILSSAWEHNRALFWLGLVVAVLTPFYMVRLVVVAFLGEPRTDHARHAKEVPLVMWLPLVLLAVPSIAAAWKFGKTEKGVSKAIEISELFSVARPHVGHAAHEAHTFITGLSIAAVVIGLVLAFLVYRNRKSEPFTVAVLRDKLYFDELYDALVRYVQGGLAFCCRLVDQLLIGGLAVGGLSKLVSSAGSMLRMVQVGNLQAYAFLFGAGVVILIYLVVF